MGRKITGSILPYLSPTNVRVFIGTRWLDDVASISYTVQDERTPYYGFKSRLYDAVGVGPTIVQGQLLCHYRVPGYLTRVIEEVLARKERTSGNPGVAASAEQPPVDLGDHTEELFARDPAAFKRWQQQLNALFYGFAPRGRARASEAQIGKAPFDLRVIYRSPLALGEAEPTVKIFERLIQSVYLTGESQEISIVSGGGDECLFEVYSFLARNVVDVQSDQKP